MQRGRGKSTGSEAHRMVPFEQGRGLILTRWNRARVSANFDHTRHADRGDGADLVEDFGRDGGIYVDQAQGNARLLVAAEREACDIDSALAQNRSHAADDAGHVLIADEENGAAQGRLDVHVVDAQDAERPLQAHHAEHRIRARFGPQGDAERIRERGAARAPHLDNLQAPRLRERPGVDEVHFLVEDLVQNPFQHGVFDQVSVQFRQPPVVADAHFLPALAGNLRDERAEFFAQLEVGRKFLELLGRNRGHIDGVRRNAEQQVVADLLGDAYADDFLRLFGGAGDVGSGDDVWVGDQTRVLGRLA